MFMYRDVIIMNNRRWVADELVEREVIESAVPSDQVVPAALELAQALKVKGVGPARAAMGGIKAAVYKPVLDALEVQGAMGYSGRTKGVDRPDPSDMSGPGGKRAKL